MNELESVCANLAVAWWTLEEKAASVERMLSDSDFSDFSDFSRSVRDLADCVDVVRTAIAVAEASEFSETNFLAMGLSGVPLELYRCRTNLEFSPSLRRVTSLLARAQTCLESHLVVPWIEQHSVSELVASLERACVTAYVVPVSCHLPNWLNVQCALSVADRCVRAVRERAPLRTRVALLAKVRAVQAAVFGSPALRHPTPEAVMARKDERSRLPFYDYPENVPDNAEFSAALEIAQSALRDVLRRFCWRYVVETIEGDGNCFFRAVVRALVPHVPRDFEDVLSLQLRKWVNSSEQLLTGSAELKALSEFEVADESDRHTMSRAGVWADHVQIAKVAALIGRSLWLLRCDDAELALTADGDLSPSEHYRIGAGGAALRILYQSAPGHFETVLPVALREWSLQDALSALPVAGLEGVCDVYFRFETALLDLEELRTTPSTEPEVWSAIVRESTSTAETLARQLAQLVVFLRDGCELSKFSSVPLWRLFGELAQELAADARLVAAQQQVEGGGVLGPLQQLVVRLQTLAPSVRWAWGELLKPPAVVSAATAPASVVVQLPPPSLTKAESPPPPGPAVAPRRIVTGSLSDLLAVDDANDASWSAILERAVRGGGGGARGGALKLSAARTTVSAAALSQLFKAVEKHCGRSEEGGGGRTVHLELVDCVLDEDCCRILCSQKPSLVTQVALERCVVAAAYELRFQVKRWTTAPPPAEMRRNN